MKGVFKFMLDRRKVWLTPVILTVLVFLFLLFAVKGRTIAPFVYRLF